MNSKPKEDPTHDTLDRLTKLEDNQMRLMRNLPTDLLKCDKVRRPDPDTYEDVENTSKEINEDEVDTTSNHSKAMTWTSGSTEYKEDNHINKLQDDLKQANETIRKLQLHQPLAAASAEAI